MGTERAGLSETSWAYRPHLLRVPPAPVWGMSYSARSQGQLPLDQPALGTLWECPL